MQHLIINFFFFMRKNLINQTKQDSVKLCDKEIKYKVTINILFIFKFNA